MQLSNYLQVYDVKKNTEYFAICHDAVPKACNCSHRVDQKHFLSYHLSDDHILSETSRISYPSICKTINTVLISNGWIIHFPSQIKLKYDLYYNNQLKWLLNEPPHDKNNKIIAHLAKTQISLSIRPVWSQSSLCAQCVAKDPSCLHADSEDSV